MAAAARFSLHRGEASIAMVRPVRDAGVAEPHPDFMERLIKQG